MKITLSPDERAECVGLLNRYNRIALAPYPMDLTPESSRCRDQKTNELEVVHSLARGLVHRLAPWYSAGVQPDSFAPMVEYLTTIADIVIAAGPLVRSA